MTVPTNSYLFHLYSYPYIIHTGSPDVSLHMVELERGCLGITSAGKGYILAIYGETLAIGLLRGRLDTLSAYFTRMFEQLK